MSPSDMGSDRANKKPPTSLEPNTTAFSDEKQRVKATYTPKKLVGNIVEKGFSSIPSNPQKPSFVSLPQQTVLSFPVARHRSHGPYWNPLNTAPEIKEDELEDDKDETDYAPISALANSIKRKEKKALDFSRWRDFVPGGVSNSTDSSPSKKDTIPTQVKNKILSTTFSPGNDEAFIDSSMSLKRPKPSCNAILPNSEHKMQFSHSNGLELATEEERLGIDESEKHKLMSSTQRFGSTMDDIDAENSARLSQMSSQEIVDAQSEIIEKMNPARIEMLMKRGLDKLGNKKSSALEHKDGGQDIVRSHLPENSKSLRNDNVGSELPFESLNSNSWKIWSERVEKVRELKFSLEGNVLEVDSHQVSSGCEPGGVRADVGNVAKRDFLRTEGDPAAFGYSIIEVMELIRSMVPAQRSLALKLLESILNNALFNLLNKTDHAEKNISSNRVDWQAIWAYALGPEPQLALSLRIALDDNHHSVVLACAKVIQWTLSCDMNEKLFDAVERVPTSQKAICTAPVFRSRPEMDTGFLQGGFWKYSTKPSNILPSYRDEEDDGEEERTIQDDVIVAGQDISAGFVRMGILPRICYLLEMEPIPALVECLISVLIGLARHSPTCANAIVQCPRLIQNVTNFLTSQGMIELPCQIKSITLLKVLSQMDKRLCSDFVIGGVFNQVMWHWYRSPVTIDQWVQSGKEHCKLTAALMAEQLRLWGVCISYGYCLETFTDFFPQMYFWISQPAFSRLLESNTLEEFAHVTREAYLTLGALAIWLPRHHTLDQLNKQGTDLGDDGIVNWSWCHAVPVVEFALNWLTLKSIPYVSSAIYYVEEVNINNSLASSMIWVISAVLHMLYCIFDRIIPESSDDDDSSVPRLPKFVLKVGNEIVKNRFFSIGSCDSELKVTGGGSLFQALTYLNNQDNFDGSLSSLSCLLGLIRLASSVDKCIQRARNTYDIQLLTGYSSELDNKILVEGIINCVKEDLSSVMNAFGKLIILKLPVVQSFESFGRGGPAPGVGVGWGSPAGGYWSVNMLQAQTSALLVLELVKLFPIVHEIDFASVEAMGPALQRVESLLAVCLVAGPGDRFILEEALDILFQPLVLKYLGFFLLHFLHIDKILKPFNWQYEENDYFLFSKVLNSHFKSRWLNMKLKSSGDVDKHNQISSFSANGAVLETIHEAYENKVPEYSFCIQWAHQRLPIPTHWFLSAICSIGEQKKLDINLLTNLDVAKSGLFFLLCLEALSSLMFPDVVSSVLNVSFVWKLHALSMSLHANMAVLQEEKTRNVFESLQVLYGKQLDDLRCQKTVHDVQNSMIFLSRNQDNPSILLSFQSKISEGYPTFVENLIEQFGSVSYGDIIFGRQIAIYLHRTVDIPVRLAAWNALSNAHLLELLPPLEMCFSETEGYLEPPEDNEAILTAYAKSWTSGYLDRAFTRGTVGFSLALHHLFSFIFKSTATDNLKLRNKLIKSLLRCYSHKPHDNEMLLHLVQYKLPSSQDPKHSPEVLQRFDLLKANCDGNSSLIRVLESLKSDM